MPVRDGIREARRFACTACGKCCDLGPEMELGETAALAGNFVMSVIFKVHGIPLDETSPRAFQWWRAQGSRIPIRAAFAERRRHLASFASRHRSDRRNGRELYLTISASVDDYGEGACPALVGGRCGIYDRRPLTCRTVPVHYSRPPSSLRDYLDTFVATPGYECDTESGPVILEGNAVVSPELRASRERAVAVARADRAWKAHILATMDDAAAARRADLPTYDDVLHNSDDGYATSLPIIVAWRAALRGGLISPEELARLSGAQLALVRRQIALRPANRALRELVPLYEVGVAATKPA